MSKKKEIREIALQARLWLDGILKFDRENEKCFSEDACGACGISVTDILSIEKSRKTI